MSGKYNRFIAVLLIGAITLIFLISLFSQVSGNEILGYIQKEDISLVTIEKTLENSDGMEQLKNHELTADELTQFYDYFAEMKLKNIDTSSFKIESEVRYYISFKNHDGNEVCTMKFYNDDALIFDYIYGTKSPVHERYKIINTGLVDYFELIL